VSANGPALERPARHLPGTDEAPVDVAYWPIADRLGRCRDVSC